MLGFIKRGVALVWFLLPALILLQPVQVGAGDISAGAYHTAVIGDGGTVWAWGRAMGQWAPLKVSGSAGDGELSGIKHIAAGGWHTIAVAEDGRVWAWGMNDSGQLGDGTRLKGEYPVRVLGEGGAGHLSEVVFASAGGRHNAVIKSDGSLWVWGSNSHGQLGTGESGGSEHPVRVKGPGGEGYFSDAVYVSAGFHTTFAAKSDGTVWSWGRNASGQLGDGTQDDRNIPVRVRGAGGDGYILDVKEVSAGWDHTLMLKSDGSVWSCGMSWNGLLGSGDRSDSAVPVRVRGSGGEGYLEDVMQVAAGWRHSLAVKSDGTVWAWGRNQEGQLGNGTNVPAAWQSDPDLSLYEYYPVQVRGVRGEGAFQNSSAVAAAGEHSAAAADDGSVYVWGSNNSEQLGLGIRGYPFMRSNPERLPGVQAAR